MRLWHASKAVGSRASSPVVAVRKPYHSPFAGDLFLVCRDLYGSGARPWGLLKNTTGNDDRVQGRRTIVEW